MRKFTKSLLTLALLVVGVGGAKADDVVVDLTADMFKTWSSTDADASVTGTATIDFNVGSEITNGAVLCGTSSVDGFIFVDLTNYTKIVFTGTPGEGKESMQLRVLYNRVGKSGSNGEVNPVITKDNPTVELNISDLMTEKALTYFHLVTIKAGWGQTGTITSIKLVKPSDPLEVPKANLKNAIDLGKLQNSFAKTTDSWTALQTAISEGEAEYASPTDESTLTAKTNAITSAISGLKLQDGYTNLTSDMFKLYSSVDNPGEGSATVNTVTLFAASDLPYGDPSVGEKNWADMTTCDKFIILTVGETKPRLCMNRLVAGGQQAETQADSKMLDINPNNAFTWSTEKYQTIEGNSYTIDLKKIVEDYGFARLHSVKKQGYGTGVTVTDFLLHRTVDVKENYATFGSLYKNAKLNGVTAYAAKISGSKVVLTEVTNVPAGKGVIVEAAAAGSYAPTFDVAADDIDTDLRVSNGTVEGDGSTIYVLANKTNGVGFYKLAAGQKVPAGKAYLTVTSSAPDFIGFEGMNLTGIETVKAAKTNNEIFNLAGQRVAKTAKGLYIVNGKKVVIK